MEEIVGPCVGTLLAAGILVVLILVLVRLADLKRAVEALRENIARLTEGQRGTVVTPGPSSAEASAPSASAPSAQQAEPTPRSQQPLPPTASRPVDTPQKPPAPPAMAQVAATTEIPIRLVRIRHLAGAVAQPSATEPPPSGEAPSVPPQPQASGVGRRFELFLGTKLLAWVGILVLLTGSVLFILWAHQRHLLSDLTKVLLHVGVGAALLGAGEWASRKTWTPLARTLTGGGIAELLFASFAASVLYGMIGWQGFFLSMGVVVALAIVLALRYNSLTISIIATTSGVAVPLMLWNMHPDYHLVLAFLAAVDISVMALAWFRQWRPINLIAFAGTVLNVLWWLGWRHGFRLFGDTYPEGVPPSLAVGAIGGFFALFLAVSLVYHLGRRQHRPLDLPVFVLNPLWAYPSVYFLFNDRHHGWMAPLAAGLGVLYLALAALIRRRCTAAASSLYSLAIALGVALLALAAPIQFDGLVIPMTLALLAVVLYVAAEITREHRLQVAGLCVYVLTALSLLACGADLTDRAPRVFLNQRLATLAACIVSLAATSAVLRRSRVGGLPGRRPMATVASLVAHGLTLLAFTLEVDNYYHLRHVPFDSMDVQLVCDLGYACYAVAMLLAGAALRRRTLRIASAALLLLTLGKALTSDAAFLFANQAHAIWNVRAAVLGACILWLASAAAMVRRWPSSFIQPRHVPVLVLLAHALGLMLFTLEARTFFAHYDNLATSHLARQMTYSIGYALYACTLLAVGFLRRQAYLRAAGLVLFAGVLLKIFVYDLKELRELYRIFSFLGLAVLLLTGAYLYHRFQHLLLATVAREEPCHEDESA